MTDFNPDSFRQKGQSVTEMALVLPILLFMVLGVFELGRVVFIFNAVNNASREAARAGAATGATTGGVPRYLSCGDVRQAAIDTAFLSGLQAADVQVSYDTPSGSDMQRYGTCNGGTAESIATGNPLSASDVTQGDRLIVTVTRQINPILPFLPSFSPTFATARTILKDIVIGPPECSDGADNDGDGDVDYPADSGCTSANDTIEAVCYRLSVVALPEDAGTMSLNPGTNCSNRYIEGTIINLEAFKDIRKGDYYDTHYTFDHWEGPVNTAPDVNPTTVTMDSDKSVTAHFRLMQADLAVVKKGPASVYAEDTINYTIELTNPYTDTARQIVVTDTLPAEVSFTSASPGCTHSGDPLGGTVVCTLATLVAGPSSAHSFDIIVEAPAVNSPTNILNSVVATAFDIDPDSSNNSSQLPTTILPRAEVSVVRKDDSADPVYAGDNYAYTIEVGNTGPSVATGVVFTDSLPVDIVPEISSLPSGCLYDGSTREVVCTIGNLLVGATAVRTFSVTPLGNGRLVTNNVTVSANEFENQTSDNSGSEDTQIISQADLEIVKSGPSSVFRDNSFDYRLTVTNNGPSDATGIQIVDTLPSGMQYSTFTSTIAGTTCSTVGNTVTCQLNSVLNGNGATAVITLVVNPTVAGTFTNYATVSSSTVDNTPGNNISNNVITTVSKDVLLSISVTPSSVTVNEGETIDYTIRVDNNGASTANNVQMTFAIPAGLSLVNVAKPGNWNCDTAVNCSPSNGLLSGKSGGTFIITVSADVAGIYDHAATVSESSGTDTASVTTTVLSATTQPLP